MKEDLIAIRRDFHRHAEAKWTEFRTAAKIAEFMLDLKLPILLGGEMFQKNMGFGMPDPELLAKHIERAVAQGGNPELIAKMEGHPGVVAIIDTGRPGPVVGYRFDIDSLPFSETTDPNHRPNKEGFGSINEGACHACGHDGHAAIGMIFARELLKIQDQLVGKMKLVFQPSEEGGGGARGIVAKGIFDDVDYFFAGHIGLSHLNSEPVINHTLVAGAKDFLANRRFDVEISGKAAHPCGDPQKGKNALLAACTMALNIHTIAPHAEGKVFFNVGKISGGTSRNTIAPMAHLEIEVRGTTEEIALYGEERLRQVIAGAAMSYDVEVEIKVVGCTSAGAADDKAINIVMESVKKVPWFQHLYPEGSVGGTDDASEMLTRVQEHGGCGTYFGLGADFVSSFHDQAFDFDEEVLEPSVQLFLEITKDVLNPKLL